MNANQIGRNFKLNCLLIVYQIYEGKLTLSTFMSEYSGGSDIWLMEMVQKAQDQADARAESMMGSPVWDTIYSCLSVN